MSGETPMTAPDSPMMRQYWSIKERHPDSLLFFRMGDFYEMFFDDAKDAASVLDISLTTRGRYQGKDIPMCGVPVHSADSYLMELIRAGRRVAVCEQTEDPEEARRRGSRELVRREVVRVITPGTLVEDSLLEPRRNNFLAAYSEVRDEGGVAWLDLSTGEFRVAPCARDGLAGHLARVQPRELLLPQRMCDDRALVDRLAESGASPTPLGAPSFDSDSAGERLRALYQVSSLEPYGAFTRAELSAMGAVADYLHLTQQGGSAAIGRPVREQAGERMDIDAATRRNLEIVETLSGAREGSLLAAVDRTVTGAGARLLAARLGAPSTDMEEIGARLDAVQHFYGGGDLAERAAACLRGLPDAERAMARLGLGRGGPRDLGALRAALQVAAEAAAMLGGADLPARMAESRAALEGLEELRGLLERALAESLPLAVADGEFVAAEYAPELDEARALRDESVALIESLQQSYRDRTGVVSLRIRRNNVLGYFVEVRDKHARKLTAEEMGGLFSHRQTISSAGRFSTAELADLESRIAGADARARDLETGIFEELRAKALDSRREVAALAAALAEIDLAAALGRLAREDGWSRPEMSGDLAFRVEGGRHPVVERALREGFVANDCDLTVEGEDAAPLWVVTGPNMAGKSTFLRQNALIAVLAQAGSYVPARSARLGLVDRLFSRVGAADDLARGRSTFMVEMVETAAILHQATPRSLVILDEIGRGTATYDGLSIAWAVLEHLRQVNGSRALFATHFHELTALAERVEGVRNVTVKAEDWEGKLVFLHEVTEGVADRSYGVQVARLAGLPDQLVERAQEILGRLEEERSSESGLADLPLFDARAPTAASARKSEVEERLAEMDPDSLTPRQALDMIYDLKRLLP